MNKLMAIVIVVCCVVGAYLFLTVAMPIIAGLASSANVTISEVTDPSKYPGTQPTLLAAPWVMYFVPGVIGIVMVIIILRHK